MGTGSNWLGSLSALLLVALPGEIHDAVQRGRIERVRELLELNPSDLERRGSSSDTPLHVAARYGRTEVAELLLRAEADPNAVAQNGFAPLHLVSRPEMARLLIAGGADPEQRDSAGVTPLMRAAESGYEGVALVLLEAGVEFDLNTAIVLGHKQRVRELLALDPELARRAPGRQFHPSLSRTAGHPLQLAASMGDVELVELLLDSGAPLHASLEHGVSPEPLTALCYAVWAGHLKVAALLLARGASTKVAGGNKFRGNLLDYAVQASTPEMIQLLLRYGAEGSHPSEIPDPPLHMVAWLGRVDAMRILLEQGAELDERIEGATPLLLAVLGGQSVLARELLARGARLDLYAAAGLGMLSELRAFLDADPDALERLDARVHWSPLMHATFNGQQEVVRELLARGAEPDRASPADAWAGGRPRSGRGLCSAAPRAATGRMIARNGGPLRALDLAVGRTHTEVAAMLLEAGAQARDELLARAVRSTSADSELVALFLEHGARLDAPDDHGNSLLALAVRRGQREAAEFLVEQGCALDFRSACALGRVEFVRAALARDPAIVHAKARPSDAPTPLALAATWGEAKVVELLFEAGAGLEVERGESPLACATRRGHAEVIEQLLALGADPSRVDAEGDGLLHVAAGEGQPELVAFWLERGLDPEARNDRGSTPTHAAATGGSAEALTVLLDAGVDIDSQNEWGCTPLHDAAQAEFDDTRATIALLLARGADLHARDLRGATPLDWARRPPLLGILDPEVRAQRVELLERAGQTR